MSSVGEILERFLDSAVFDRAPWIAVSFAAGIASWFALPSPKQWIGALVGALGIALCGFALFARFSQTRLAILSLCLAFAAGLAIVWLRSEVVGAQPIARPFVEQFDAYVIERVDQPAYSRARLVLAVRLAPDGPARKIRVNVPLEAMNERIGEGAILRLRARLYPPSNAMFPGAYDFARAAWFDGLSATGTAIGEVAVLREANNTDPFAAAQRRISAHVRERVAGAAGAIAATLASGDRGALDQSEAAAMRDAGLTHLLAISGLHVSAVIALTYLLAIKSLALVPSLALRVRLPVIAAATGAAVGIGYTLLTGAQVPTVRACAAAMLVLTALALGREPLSMRVVALAAMFVLLLWPESLVMPGFQMSFAAVLAIVALNRSQAVRRFLAPREEGYAAWFARRAAMLFATSLLIEVTLMPIALYHFHRAGIYGAFANLFAIPLVTFVSMPLIALGLVLDSVGLGAPVWWMVERSLNLLLQIAHFTSAQSGAVRLSPQMDRLTFGLFCAGGLWLALWSGARRWWGAIAVALATLRLVNLPVPDLLITGDGRQLGVTTESGRLLVLRDSRSRFLRENLLEYAGLKGDPIALADWPGARCSREFCVVTVERGGRPWVILAARNQTHVPREALEQACARSDIVIAARGLPEWCRPRWFKADRRLLRQTGGLSIDLDRRTISSVAQYEGEHGWAPFRTSRVRSPASLQINSHVNAGNDLPS